VTEGDGAGRGGDGKKKKKRQKNHKCHSQWVLKPHRQKQSGKNKALKKSNKTRERERLGGRGPAGLR